MNSLDFTELGREPAGESLEALVRKMGERLGMAAHWTGRGSDGGRDLILIERQEGVLAGRTVRWLVNCKDHARSRKSANEHEVGSIIDKLEQHGCDGFLLATTTTASSGLKERMDKLDVSGGGRFHTKVWDRFEIEALLGQNRFADLRRQFFPKQAARDAAATIDSAREVVEKALPRTAIGLIRKHLVPFKERLAQLDGSRVWPADVDQRRLIDELKWLATRRSGIRHAAKLIQDMHFDAFSAFADALIRNFAPEAKLPLSEVASCAKDNGFVYNAVEFLREFDGFALAEEIEITRKCDGDTLHELYNDFISELLTEPGLYAGRLPSSVRAFDDEVRLESVRVKELEISGGDGISFVASVGLKVEGQSFNPGDPPAGCASFDCEAHGYLIETGLQIESLLA